MPNLFIIGNGFDIAHGMKTKYNDFRDYLCNNYLHSNRCGIYVPKSVIGHRGEETQADDEVVNLIMYLLDTVAPFDSKCHDADWSELEKLLGEINLSECFDTVEKQYDREGDRNYAWERDVAAEVCGNMALAVPRITEFLSEWIQTVPILDSHQNGFQKLPNLSDDLFLTFNYTQTLEQLYHCPKENVCHIHGAVGESTFDYGDDLVLGHCGNQDYINGESIPYEMGCGLQSIYEDLRKDTEQQIILHHSFFERIRRASIEKIYSYGFSFSDVDIPYIRMICECLDTKSIIWLFNSYDSSIKQKSFHNAVRTCGFEGTFGIFDS